MRIIVPSPNSSSLSSPLSPTESFTSAIEYNLSSNNIPRINMTGSSQKEDIRMGEASTNVLQGLSSEDLQDLVKLLAEKRLVSQQELPTSKTSYPSHSVTLPKWSGDHEDFSFYMDRLRIRVEKEMAQYRDPSSICIDIIDTLPEDKKSRLASWFAKSKRLDKFDWRNLLDVIQREFEDVQAQQTAHEFVLRMEQGRNQLFAEFVKDFEHRIASCGGEELFTPAAKTRQLKASLNSRLWRASIGVKLIPVRDYDEWVLAVREVAVELESFADYRPKGATQTGTKVGPPKTGSAALPESSRPERDADGDTKMTGMDAILAAIGELSVGIASVSIDSNRTGKDKKENKRDSGKSSGKKPRAPWRSKSEFDRLYKEGVCTRCSKNGHMGPKCPSFRPARRPKQSINHLNEELEEEESSESGHNIDIYLE